MFGFVTSLRSGIVTSKNLSIIDGRLQELLWSPPQIFVPAGDGDLMFYRVNEDGKRCNGVVATV